MVDFVSLHNYTHFSILRALTSPKELFNTAKSLNQKAIAVTDNCTFSGVWDSLKASKETGVKLIQGCEFNFISDVENKEEKTRSLVLIAKNHNGYRNLLQLHRAGFDNSLSFGNRVIPVVDWKLLEKYSEGVICLTGSSTGIVARSLLNKNLQEAQSILKRLKEIYGENLGFEVQANALERPANNYNGAINQFFVNFHGARLAKQNDVRVVATTNSMYVRKEDAEVHDVLLAIASRQPVYSNARLKYDVHDFYIKSGEEVLNFFKRSFDEKDAISFVENSVYFSDLCEDPEWIDPKFSNPTGKELPLFPVKDEPNYGEFKQWLSNQSDDVKSLDEDKSFLRYSCFKVLSEKIPAEKHAQYTERLKEEFDVLEYHGFSSYMLIVADFLNWARKNDIPVGPGRGCLTGDTFVLTDKGYVYLKDIDINDKVYSHSGNLNTVLNKFTYDVSNESLLRIKSYYSFNDLVMTKDHKVLISTALTKNSTKIYKNGKKITYQIFDKFSKPEWIKAEDIISNKHYIFTKWLDRKIDSNLSDFDLFSFDKEEYKLDGDYIIQSRYKKNNISIRAVAKESGISFEHLRKFKTKNIPLIPQEKIVLENYLMSKGYSVDDFLDLDNKIISKIHRYIKQDEDFYYLVGRWIGDGNFHGRKEEKGISIVFNSKDIKGIARIKDYLEKLGFYVCEEHRKENNVLLTVSNKLLFRLFNSLINEYENAFSKHLPHNFRKLDNKLIKALLTGLRDSDGYARENNKRDTIKTTSIRLVKEIKEALLYLHIPSKIYVEKNPHRYGKPTARSYTIHFTGIHSPLDTRYLTDDGFFSKIREVVQEKNQYVYDITVENDRSYLTTNGIVHNSVGGSLIGYLIGIHKADPIKYDLIFARFHNKSKNSYPDVDNDIATSGRNMVKEYITNKYGADHVAHVSNVNTITPKVYVRDICRSLQLGGSRENAVKLGNEIADSIPADIKTIDKALEDAPLFAEYAKRYPELKKYKEICGKYRAWSTHAGGFIISQRPLNTFIPLRKDKDGAIAVEFDKERSEENGLVKIDILGSETLDIIKNINDLVCKYKNIDVPKEIDYSSPDKEAYDLISEGNTFGVFQLGTSSGTIDLCKKIKPKSINDISHINSLARPAARDIRDAFIAAKEGKKKFQLLHPSLKRAFEKTFGFGLYEESLMYLAQDVAGWDLHEADRLRKLTKEKGKNPKKAMQWRQEFIDDALKNKGIPNEIAIKIWDDIIEKFQGYGFNNSLHFSESVDIYNSNGDFLTTKQIKDVEAGDWIRSYDQQLKQEILVEITNKYDHGVQELYEIELDTGETVKCTMDHKFRVKETQEMLPLWKIIKEKYSIVVRKDG